MTLAWMCIILTLFAVALTDSLNWHWGYAILAALAFPIVSVALFRTVHPFEFKTLAAPWEEI
jgi:hypothetical protein